MLEAYMPASDEFYFGTLYKNRNDKNGEEFHYELVEERRKSYGQIINNLIAEQGRKTIMTHDISFKVGNIVVDEDNCKWFVQDVAQVKESINPQANLILKVNPATAYVASLVLIDNVEEE